MIYRAGRPVQTALDPASPAGFGAQLPPFANLLYRSRYLAAPGGRPRPSQSEASIHNRRRPIRGQRLLETRNP